MKLKKIISMALSVAMIVPCISACNSAKDDIPELTWYFGGAEQRDYLL